MPEIDASVRTLVVYSHPNAQSPRVGAPGNDAAEMNESVESDAFVMPSSSGPSVQMGYFNCR